MPKELPFFKFEPSQYDNGNIQLCSFEAQGVFANVCSMYWQRFGELSYKLALQKICKGNATALDSLIQEDVIKVIDGMICIDFLNEQLSEFENTSKVNRKNARLGWEKRRLNATALPTVSDPNAIREEKRREEKNINVVAPAPTVQEKAILFQETLKPFADTYGTELLNNFAAYWTEPSKSGKKLRFEDEKFFDTSRRLATWKQRQNNEGVSKKVNYKFQ
jgi:hypothetical protein